MGMYQVPTFHVRSMVKRSKHIILCLLALVVSVNSYAQTPSTSEKLNELGKGLTTAFRTNDFEKLQECFFSRAEVKSLLQIVAESNGGDGQVEFSTDSMYQVFSDELNLAMRECRKASLEDNIEWDKIKFEEMGLSNITQIGDVKSADLILVVRVKKRYFMITFPQSFMLTDEWKIGPMIHWVGQVTQ